MTSEGEALLAFINTFPEVQPLNITKFIDLKDGKGISLLWNAVHPNKIKVESLATLSGPDDWLNSYKNLREVDKVISPVLTEKGMKEKVDFTKIARLNNEEELFKFVSPLVIIAVSSPLKKEVVTRIKSLSPQNKNAIQGIIKVYAQKKKEAKMAQPPAVKPPESSNASQPAAPAQQPAAPSAPAQQPAASSASTQPQPQQPSQPAAAQTETDKKPSQPPSQPAAPSSTAAPKTLEQPAAPSPAPPQVEAPKPEAASAPKTPESAAAPKPESAAAPKPEVAPSQKPEVAPSQKPEVAPSQKPEVAPSPKPEAAQPPASPKPDQKQAAPMKVEDYEILVREAESQIEQLKKEIESRESQLVQLQEQANKKFKKADQSKAQLIDQTERMTSDINHENAENRDRLAQLQKDEEMNRKTLEIMELKMNRNKERLDLFNSIKKLEDTISMNADLTEKIKRYTETQAKISEGRTNADEEDEVVSPQQIDAEIERIKEDITTSIMLTEKYGVQSQDVQPAANENNETVPELAARITQMEIELTIIKDDIQSGHSGIPPDLLTEKNELSKLIKKLNRKKEELISNNNLRVELRKRMREIQNEIIEHREEEEKKLDKLTENINIQNIDLTNWLSFSSSFDAWRGSSTFLTDLRNSYL